MRAGYTETECPACHKKGTRRKDEVCVDCLELIEKGKHFEQVYNELCKMNENLIESRVPDSWCRPYYFTHKIHIGSDIHKRIAEKIVELAKAVSLPKPVSVRKWSYCGYLQNSLSLDIISESKVSVFRPFASKEKFEFEQDRIFEKETHDLLSELNELIKEGIEEVEREAVKYGKDLLMQLHNNEISPNDFLNG